MSAALTTLLDIRLAPIRFIVTGPDGLDFIEVAVGGLSERLHAVVVGLARIALRWPLGSTHGSPGEAPQCGQKKRNGPRCVPIMFSPDRDPNQRESVVPTREWRSDAS